MRALVYDLLINAVGASSAELDFERPAPEVHGRIDALLGRTLFEFKSDLRREGGEAGARLPAYLSQREKETGAHFVGVATDGADFTSYELRDGILLALESFRNSPDKPGNARDLVAWLGSVVAVGKELPPNSQDVRRELGQGSFAWNVARQELASIWAEVGARPDVRLKRELWARLLQRVYGSALNEDALFFQHTYLTTITKTMAAKVLGVPVAEPAELLSGQRFREAGIMGAVESDFFDWPLSSGRGADLVRRIARQAGRFRLEEVQADVLKGLYESLIDPQQRHFLGEYYTPDWLAERMCAEAIERPMEQRVLDPACGSGTFVFHAVRRLMKGAEASSIPVREAINRACRQVSGIDIHPVSTQIARVTFLLAIGQERLKQRPPNINVPVYIGDSLQWNTVGFLAERHVLIEVPESKELLEFPFEAAHNPDLFDAVIRGMLGSSERDAPPDSLTAWLEKNYHFSEMTINTLAKTYNTLRQLKREERNHIWGFVARNLVRPVWLSQESQKADVVIGNPPWLQYSSMHPEMQERFRKECEGRGLWMGQVAQKNDLSAYFFVRSVELYLKPAGCICFVMPYAAMTRRQFAGFRQGIYGSRNLKNNHVLASIHFTRAWAFSDRVKELFPVPSCVLFAGNEPPGSGTGRLPDTIMEVSGTFPRTRRDASLAESLEHLAWAESPWPSQRKGRSTGGYADRFRDGAIIIPSVLFRVEEPAPGFLGRNPEAPVVISHRTNLEKRPWKDVPSMRHPVEAQFLRALYLGESVAPFRVLLPGLAVIPWDERKSELLDATTALNRGWMWLYDWLAEAEALWSKHGRGRRTLSEQLDYYGQLSAQFPIAPLRVVYSASGTLPAAALLADPKGIVEHKLYWLKMNTQGEGRYLTAILNSETARKLAEGMQSRGQWGARDFDKVMLSPIPLFDAENRLHARLVKAAARAERVAAAAPLKEDMHFVKSRQKIREALQEDGVAREIDGLVAELLHRENSSGTQGSSD
ncbi:MAG: N-6 DNA methylase [Chloroflexi bacterium]|nr:N-6 DNA methylase [Chloroflexota bacterium]